MEISHPFQGVACCCLDKDKSVEDVIVNKLLGLKSNSVTHHGITCFELKLENKYYETTIHLFDFDGLDSNTNRLDDDSILNRCQAIILYGNGQFITTKQLDDKLDQFKNVNGEPRILLYHGIDEDCEPYKTLTDWCLKNEFDFIDVTEDDAQKNLIDSLSVYKWNHRLNSSKEESNTNSNDEPNLQSQLNDDTLKKLMEFDTLLGKFKAFREKGNSENIEEIAVLLSGLLGDDVDSFLENENEDDNSKQNS